MGGPRRRGRRDFKMMKFIKYIVYAVVAILLIAFAVANHEIVTVSLDPFANRENAALSFEAPFFIVFVATLMVGVAIGGVVVWLDQGRHRRRAREYRVQTEKLKADLQADPAKVGTKLVRRA
jgi:uncharacterized integral membrane protein